MAPRATQPDPEYTVTLSDGTYTIGLKTSSNTGIRRLPRGAGVERKALRQSNWTGGRGNERFATDTTRFYESTNLWSMVSGQVCNGPLVCFADAPALVAHASALPVGAASEMQPPGVGGARIRRRVIAPTGGFTAERLFFIARKVGTPAADLTIEICADNNGAIGTVLQTLTLTSDSVTDVEAKFRAVSVSQALTSATAYWVRFSSQEASLGGYWRILCDASGPYVRLEGALTELKKTIFFEYRRGLYALCIYRNGTTAAKLLINGDRGVVTGTQATTTLVDTTKAWTANQWAGCVVLIIAGTNKGEYRTIASNTSTAITLSGDPWPQACTPGSGGSEYVILGSSQWTEIGSTGLSATAKDVAVFNGMVYIAQGSTGTNYLRRMREYNNSGVFTREWAADGTNLADLLVVAPHWSTADTAIYRANNDVTQLAVANAVTWGTNLTFGTGMPAGDLETLITGLVEYDSKVYVGKEDGVWEGRDGSFRRVPIGTDKARDERNGVSMVWWNTQLFFSLLSGLERLYGSTVDDIGPDRDQGMIAARRGSIVDMVNVANMLYCSYSSLGQSSVLVTTDPGGDWHNLITFGSNTRSSGIFYQTIPGQANRLWVAEWHRIRYAIMPDELHNPINDSNMRYTWESFLTTSWIDADSPELDHYFDELRLSTRNLNATTNTLEIEYQLDDARYEDNWIPFASIPGVVVDYMATFSPYEKLSVGDTNVTGRRIRFRFRLSCNGLTPTILNAWELRLNQMNEVLYDYTFDMQLMDNIVLMNGDDALQSQLDVVTVLESWKEDATPLTLRVPMPGTTGVIDNILGHIDPVSLVTGRWNDETTELAGQIVFKQT